MASSASSVISPAAAPTGLAAVYRRRQPTATPLYRIVHQHLETFLVRASEEDPLGDGLPGWVEEECRAYLGCGILHAPVAGNDRAARPA